MTILRCPLCDFATDDVECVGAASILSAHAISHQQPQSTAVVRNRAPKLERPKVKPNISSEEWNAYFRRWSTYRTGSDIGDDIASSQLLECATEDLKDIVLRAHPTFTSKPIAEAVTLLRSLAVVPTALGFFAPNSALCTKVLMNHSRHSQPKFRAKRKHVSF